MKFKHCLILIAVCIVALLLSFQLTRQTAQTRGREDGYREGYLAGQADRYPTAYPVYLLAALEWEQPPEEVTVSAPTREDLPPQPWPFPLDAVVNLLEKPTREHPLVNGQTTYYVCRDHTCQPPRNLYS